MENVKNEILVNEGTGEVMEATTPQVELVPLEVSVKRGLKTKDGKRTFDVVEIKLVLDTYRDNKYIGKQMRKIPLSFGEKAFDDCKVEGLSESTLSSGILIVDIEGLSPIYRYDEFTDKDGKVKPLENSKGNKPRVYLNYGIYAFKKYTTNRSAFDLAGFREAKALEAEAELDESNTDASFE